MRRTVATLAAVFFALRTAEAQKTRDPVAEERVNALNTTFRFITELSDSNAVIAKCRIPEVEKNTTLASLIDRQYRARFVSPASKDTNISSARAG